MNNRDWEKLGEDVLKTVQDAVESCNYDRLNQNVGDALNQVVDGVARNVKNIKKSAEQRRQTYETYEQPNYQQANYQKSNYQKPNYQNTDYQKPRYQQQTRGKQKSELFYVNSSSKLKGILFTVFGYVFGVPLLIFSIFLLLGAIITSDFSAWVWIAFIPSVLMTAGFGIMAFKGTKALLQISRFKTYIKEIGAAEFCNISALATRLGKSSKYVVKDVEKMIEKGWFRQGHLDQQKTCLIVTDTMYHQYQLLEDRKLQQRKEEEFKASEQRKAQQVQVESRKTLSPEVQKVIEQGDAYVAKIRECNDKIPGEEISNKIYRMELIVDKIFDRVEQEPQTVSDIRKLMEYYLPTTVKLLEAYAEMDAQPVGGENIQSAKKEIEATLDTLNAAFEKLLDSLFQDKAWDVSSDISVLNTMLAQEGLKNDGLKK